MDNLHVALGEVAPCQLEVLSTGLDSRSRLRVDEQPMDVEVTFVHEQS